MAKALKNWLVSEEVGRVRQLSIVEGEPEKEIVQIFAEFNPGKETGEIESEKAGFGSRHSYLDAKKVVDEGAPELIEAMDSGKVSISTASVISEYLSQKSSQ